MLRAELGDGEIVPILGSVGPRADELIRIPATARRTPDQPHTRRGRVIGPGQNQIRREKKKNLGSTNNSKVQVAAPVQGALVPYNVRSLIHYT